MEHWYLIGKNGGSEDRYWVVTYHQPGTGKELMTDNIRPLSERPNNIIVPLLRLRKQQAPPASKLTRKAA
jgi:hypothetical protein